MESEPYTPLFLALHILRIITAGVSIMYGILNIQQEAKCQFTITYKIVSYFLISTTICLLSMTIYSPSYGKSLAEIGEVWSKIQAPFSSYMRGLPTFHDAYLPDVYAATPGIYGYVNRTILQRDSLYNNIIVKILTFGSEKVLGGIGLAAVLGDTKIPYILFLHGPKKSAYLAKEITAPGVLLYAYSWIINIPSKFLNSWDSLISNQDYISIVGKLTFGDKIIFTLDLIWSFLITIFVELPLALINTVIGFFIALICHPIDSIIAIPGCIYYGILSTLNAIWGIVSNLIMIPIHVLF